MKKVQPNPTFGGYMAYLGERNVRLAVEKQTFPTVIDKTGESGNRDSRLFGPFGRRK
jgi:hypothetical protein